MKQRALLMALACALLLVGVVAAQGSYDLSWFVIGGGGEAVESGEYALAGTIGQAITGEGNNGSYRVGSGFWEGVGTSTVEPPDAYEPDDTCAQSGLIASDGTVQVHTFHREADADWVSFAVTSGTTYLIEAHIPAGSPADIALGLYGQCGGVLEDSQDHHFSPGVRLEFSAPASGTMYIELVNHDAAVYGAGVAYHLSVRALESKFTPGGLVLVAGRLRANDPLQDNIHHVTDTVRQLFLAHGYDDSRIYYLATDAGREGWDASPTVAKLGAAITTWALTRVSADRPFTLYVIDHGIPDRVYLDEPSGEWVAPDQIDGWLSQLEAGVPGVKVNVIVEACHSGSFIELQKTASKPGRVVITSTGASRLAWASNEGAVFSDHFLTALGRGASLYASFQNARWATLLAHPDQTPWLDDDGDGIANKAGDGYEAARRGFLLAGTLVGDAWPPFIVQALGSTKIEQGQGVIQAEVRDDGDVQRVWAVIYAPSYRPPQTQEEMVQESQPTIDLAAQGNDWFSATYTGFGELGSYRLVIYAEDEHGIQARPVAIEVRTGWPAYLPLVVSRQR